MRPEEEAATPGECFLDQIEAATPWALLVEQIEPFYPKGERGRPPIGIERMLRMYIVQQCFRLADEATEDAVYDSQSIRAFVGLIWAARALRIRTRCSTCGV